MVKELLKAFYQQTGQKPTRMLFYRDGVSEGQFKAVLEQEIKQIHAACASLAPNYKPTLTFVVVQKRHHARFFPMQTAEADRTGNCQPGTVVDTKIVHPFEFDFCKAPAFISSFVLICFGRPPVACRPSGHLASHALPCVVR